MYKSENIVILFFYFLNTFLTDGHSILFPGRMAHNLLYYNVHSTDFFFWFLVFVNYYVMCARDGGVNAYLNGRVRQAGHKFNRSSARSTYIISCSDRRDHIIHTRWRRVAIENKYTHTRIHTAADCHRHSISFISYMYILYLNSTHQNPNVF